MANKHSRTLNRIGIIVGVKQGRWRANCNTESPLAIISARTLNFYTVIADLWGTSYRLTAPSSIPIGHQACGGPQGLPRGSIAGSWVMGVV